MCSNKELKSSLDEVKLALRENSTEQVSTRLVVENLSATFGTWRETEGASLRADVNELQDDMVCQKEISTKSAMKAAFASTIMLMLLGGFVTLGFKVVQKTGGF